MVDYLNALGASGSGLNIRQLTESLVAADTGPRRAAAQKKIDTAGVSISALGRLRAQFERLDAAAASVAGTSVLRATSSSSALSLTVTDKSRVTSTTASVEVLNVAQRQVLEFGGFTSADAPLGAGRVDVDYGVWFQAEGDTGRTSFAANPALPGSSITVGSGATLNDLAKALSAIPGVTARVLDKGNGTFSLGVISEPGAGSALRFTVTAATPEEGEPVEGEPAVTGGAVSLSRFDTTTTNAGVQVQEAADALLVVDGIIVFRPTNQIDDLLPGVTLTIAGPTTSAAQLSVGRDMETARSALKSLVDEVNEALKLLGELTLRATDGSASGALAGDPVADRLKRDLVALIGRPVSGHGEKPVQLSQLGVVTRRDGTLRFDETAFAAAFKARPERFDALFSDSIASPTPGVTVSGLPGRRAEAGDYAFRRDPGTGKVTVGGAETLALPAAADGTTRYIVLSGQMAGLSITAGADVGDATIRFGRSFASSLRTLLDAATTSGGAISERETRLNATMTEQTARLAEVDARATKLEARYLAQFTAMEQAVSRFKSTGTYLQSLVAQWNKSD